MIITKLKNDIGNHKWRCDYFFVLILSYLGDRYLEYQTQFFNDELHEQ